MSFLIEAEKDYRDGTLQVAVHIRLLVLLQLLIITHYT